MAGGRTDAEGDGKLAEVGAAGHAWKLTLLDADRSGFSVMQTSLSGAAGTTVNINYSGAETGGNEYVSAMIEQNDVLLYYGRIANNSRDGQASFTIPNDLALGNYTLKVFSEQYNGDKMTG